MLRRWLFQPEEDASSILTANTDEEVVLPTQQIYSTDVVPYKGRDTGNGLEGHPDAPDSTSTLPTHEETQQLPGYTPDEMLMFVGTWVISENCDL
jgi:hypothetical protein